MLMTVTISIGVLLWLVLFSRPLSIQMTEELDDPLNDDPLALEIDALQVDVCPPKKIKYRIRRGPRGGIYAEFKRGNNFWRPIISGSITEEQAHKAISKHKKREANGGDFEVIHFE